jgi:hypothetical protein
MSPAALFDLEGNLVGEAESTETFSEVVRGGIQAIASPDGRSVMLVWAQEGEAVEGYGDLRLQRFDCVDP